MSCNTGKIVLPDIRKHNAQGCTAPEGDCICVRQSTSACVIANMLHLRHSKNLPKHEGRYSAVLYINICMWITIVGGFNVSITFPIVSMMTPTVLVLIMGLHSH